MLLAQHFSSVPQPEGCQGEWCFLTHVCAHTHSQRGALLQPLNYTITQSRNCPQQELFICLYQRIILPFLFCSSLSGDERTIKHYYSRHTGSILCLPKCCRWHGGGQATCVAYLETFQICGAHVFFKHFFPKVRRTFGCVFVCVKCACMFGGGVDSW